MGSDDPGHIYRSRSRRGKRYRRPRAAAGRRNAGPGARHSIRRGGLAVPEIEISACGIDEHCPERPPRDANRELDRSLFAKPRDHFGEEFLWYSTTARVYSISRLVLSTVDYRCGPHFAFLGLPAHSQLLTPLEEADRLPRSATRPFLNLKMPVTSTLVAVVARIGRHRKSCILRTSFGRSLPQIRGERADPQPARKSR